MVSKFPIYNNMIIYIELFSKVIWFAVRPKKKKLPVDRPRLHPFLVLHPFFYTIFCFFIFVKHV